MEGGEDRDGSMDVGRKEGRRADELSFLLSFRFSSSQFWENIQIYSLRKNL